MFNNWACASFLTETTGKQKQGKPTSRKSKSPNLGQAYSAGERPSSVSSVHSEGDYHRQAQAPAQWSWDDRPSSTGELTWDLSEIPEHAKSSPQRTLLAIKGASVSSHLSWKTSAFFLVPSLQDLCNSLITHLPCAYWPTRRPPPLRLLPFRASSSSSSLLRRQLRWVSSACGSRCCRSNTRPCQTVTIEPCFSNPR